MTHQEEIKRLQNIVTQLRQDNSELLKALEQMTAYAEAYKGAYPNNVRDKDLTKARVTIAKTIK